MPAEIIDGKAIADTIRAEIKKDVESICNDKSCPPPGLGVIILGERKDSQTYVRLKHKAANECGIRSIQVELPEATTQEELEAKIDELNTSVDVDGFIVQLPLPKHINEPQALDRIAPQKDVDGLHPTNVGLLHCRGKTPFFMPCTPMGCMELLTRSGVEISGRRAVVVGRSNIVGGPVAQMLKDANATVTVVHSRTENPQSVVSEGDIVVAACGSAELIRGSWIKPGAAVIDVGTNPVDDASKKTGYRLVGDVAFDEAKDVAGKITPVPGGVGPMTIAMLLTNTVASFKRKHGITQSFA